MVGDALLRTVSFESLAALLAFDGEPADDFEPERIAERVEDVFERDFFGGGQAGMSHERQLITGF